MIFGERPKGKPPGLTWTGLDVGGPCLGTFGLNICEEPSRPGCGTLNSKTTIREANNSFGASILWRAWEANLFRC